MNEDIDIAGYHYQDAELNPSHEYLLPAILSILKTYKKGTSIFELGCGNGSIANQLSIRGFDVTGLDPSEKGINIGKQNYPDLKIFKWSKYDDLQALYGQFPIVISLEVIEHVYFPRQFASTLFNLVEGGGIAIISTPYHSYCKNLVLAITGEMDKHFTALWDHGHIKFWSFKTLRILLEEVGFQDISFKRVGRIPLIAKSMIAIAKKIL